MLYVDIEKLEEYKDDIRDLANVQFKNEETIRKCTELSNLLILQKYTDETLEAFWFCEYMQSRSLTRIGDYDGAIRHLKKSMLYQIEGSNHAKSLFMLAYIYKNQNKKKEAINCYTFCERYYYSLLEDEYNANNSVLLSTIGDVIHNKARLSNDEILLKKSRQFYEKAGVFERENDNYYIDYCRDIHIHYGHLKECKNMMKLIKDKTSDEYKKLVNDYEAVVKEENTQAISC